MIENSQNSIHSALAPEPSLRAPASRNRPGLSWRGRSLVVIVLMSFAVLGVAYLSETAGAQVERFGSVSISGASSITVDTTSDYTITTTGIPSATASYYHVEITTDGNVSEEDDCSNDGYWLFNPSSGTDSEEITVEGCSVGSGTITAILYFTVAELGEVSEVRRSTKSVAVVSATAPPPPTATPDPVISISAGTSPITEGQAAAFTVTATGTLSSNLSVAIQVRSVGSFISGTRPRSVTVNSSNNTGTISISTRDDSTDEADGTITVELLDGNDYDLHSSNDSATVRVQDNDLPRPDNPTGVSVRRSDSGPADGEVTVRWNASNDADRYRVQRGTSRGNYRTVESSTSRTSVELSAPCGTTYYFRVAAYGDGSNAMEVWSGYSDAEAAPTCPSAPTIRSITTPANSARGRVEIDWRTAYDTSGHQMQRGIAGANGTITFGNVSAEDSVIPHSRDDLRDFFHAPCGERQYFRVASRLSLDDDNADDYDNRWSEYSRHKAAPLCTAPAPTRLAVDSRTPYSTTLTWRSGSGVSSYKIERSRSGANIWTTVSTTISSSATSYRVGALTCGQAYDYRISANGDGQSYLSGFGSPSTTLSVNGDGDSACPVLTIERPQDSSGDTIYRIFEDTDATFIVKADKAVNRSLTVRISVTDEGNVVSGTAPTTFTFPANTTSATLTIDTDDDTRRDGAGSITVTLVDRGTSNDYNLGSDKSTRLIIDDDDLAEPGIPGNIVIRRVFDREVDLVRFSHDSVDNARNYVVQRGTSSDPDHSSFTNVLPYRQTQPEGTSRSLFTADVYGASCDETYYFRVAVEGDGEELLYARGDFSTPLATPRCTAPPPDDFDIDDNLTTGSTVTVRWTHVPGVTQYKIERWLSGAKYKDVAEINHAAGTTNLSYEITGLACDTTYRYAISAKGDGVDRTDDDLAWYPDEYGTRSSNTRGTTDTCPVISISTPTPAAIHPQSKHRIFEGDDATFIITAIPVFEVNTDVNISVSTSDVEIDGAVPTMINFDLGDNAYDAASGSYSFMMPTADNNNGQDDPTGRGSITVTLVLPDANSAVHYQISSNNGTAVLTVDDDDLDDPPIPAGLAVAPKSDPYTAPAVPVEVTVDDADGVDSLHVERRLGEDGEWTVVDAENTIDCAGDYKFRARWYGDGEETLADFSGYSGILPVNLACPRAPAPANFRVSGTAQYTMGFAWDAVDDEDATYTLERSDDEGITWALADDDARELDATSYTVTGLQCGTSYAFRVSAKGDGQPYSTDGGHYAKFASQQLTSACPEVSIELVPPSSSTLAPVDYKRVFEGDSATFSLTTSTEFPDDVTINLSVTKPRYNADPDASQTITTTETVTFSADTETMTFPVSTLENSAENGRGTLTVTLALGTGYRPKSDKDSATITVDDDDLDDAPAPADVRFHVIDGNYRSYQVTWTEHDNVKRYVFQRRAAGAGDDAWESAGSYTRDLRALSSFASTTCGIDYEYRVASVGDGERYIADFRRYSPTLSLNRTCPPAPAPGNLTARANTEYTANLQWTAVANAAAYWIEKSSDDGTTWDAVSDQVDTVAAPATSFSVTGLDCYTSYQFRIRARGDGSPYLATYGGDDYSSDATSDTRTPGCPRLSINNGAPIVEGESATYTISSSKTVGTPFTIAISVTQVHTTSGNPADYILGDAPETFTFPQGVSSAVLSIRTENDTQAEPRGSLTVTLEADAGQYLLGATTSATVQVDDDDLDLPNPPNDLSIAPAPNHPTFYRAEWTRANDVARYQVEFRASGDKDWDSFGSYTIRSTIGISKSLLCGTDYEFRIRAFGDGDSTRAVFGGYSSTVAYTTADCLALDAPEDLEASDETVTSIDLSWSPVTGAVKYKVEYMAETDEDWTVFDDALPAPGVGPFDTSPNGTIDPTVTVTGLECRTIYSFRVSARGNGRLYPTGFSDHSDVAERSTERSYTLCNDRVPSFGSKSIDDLTLDPGTAMSVLQLPEATGGDFPLTYSITPDLSEGLSFDPNTRRISGTPVSSSCALIYTYTATDADPEPSDRDSAELTFAILVSNPGGNIPEFVVSSIDDWTYSVTTNSTALQLPEATGGFGPLRYTLTPALPAGITFDADNFLIYGAPTSTAAATEYTYTVSNMADCADTDSDSISFTITVPAGPAFPAREDRVRPAGLTAEADNASGTMTLTWDPDDNVGYKVFQTGVYGSPRIEIPSTSVTLTCGGRVVTVCPPGSTSAVISGLPSGYYSYWHGMHNGHSFEQPVSAYTSVIRLATLSDPKPRFLGTTDDLVFVKDHEIDVIQLPIAVGGNGRLDYTLTPALPAGLSFNPLTRTISGTPTAATAAATYTLTATDSDATNPDTDTISFELEVLDGDTELEISGLTSPVYEGQQLSFTVTGSNIATISSYEIEVNAYAGANSEQSTTNSDLGFNSGCTDVEESDDVTSDASSHTATFTLHVCDSEYNGGIVTATLVDDDDNVITGDWIYLEAREITVRIKAENPFPVTGDTEAEGGPDTVTLTVVADAPTGTTFAHQWQEKSGTSWSDIADATDETYKIADVSSSTTKTIRVKVTSGGETYESGEVSITWNLGQTLREITDALVDDLIPPMPTSFQRAEGDLIRCVARPAPLGVGETYDSFAHLMNHYTGKLKTLLDSGTCSTHATTAWNSLIVSFEDTLRDLKTDDSNTITPAGELLDTPDGEVLEDRLTSVTSLKNWVSDFVVPAAFQLERENARVGNGEDDSNQANAPREGDSDAAFGLDCIPEPNHPILGNGASLEWRLNALDCLTKFTPWSFWLTLANQAQNDFSGTELTRYRSLVSRIDWLDHGPLSCPGVATLHYIPPHHGNYYVPVGLLLQSHRQLAGCLKYQLAVNSLPLFSTDSSLVFNDVATDSAWNPRNKALSILTLEIDLACAYQDSNSRPDCLADPQSFVGQAVSFGISNKRRDDILKDVTSTGSHPWPISEADVQHAKARPHYIECDSPIAHISTIDLNLSPGASTLIWPKVASCSGAEISDAYFNGPIFTDSVAGTLRASQIRAESSPKSIQPWPGLHPESPPMCAITVRFAGRLYGPQSLLVNLTEDLLSDYPLMPTDIVYENIAQIQSIWDCMGYVDPIIGFFRLLSGER